MLIIPAIDLQDGCVVRFVQGRLNKKIYSRDPVKTARHWVKQGARLLHVVDLDGAFSGVPVNLDRVKEIVAAIAVPIEFGGGVRDLAAVREILGLGVQRVVLGTRAVEDKKFLAAAFASFGERVIVSLDAQGTKLMVKGWQAASRGEDVFTFAARLREMGFSEIIYTDTQKDGTLKGPNIKNIKALLAKSGLRVIASGGISSLEDIKKLKALEKSGLSGIIMGKSLYEGKFTLPAALRLA
jgi:phosphoribosylformimino-5-aminoimidazole carboxamide ribotide isomerase